MLSLLGDVTSTVSGCIFVLYSSDILSMSFFLCFVYKFHPPWNLYTNSTQYSLDTSYSLSSVDWIWSEFSTLCSELYSLKLC